MATFRDGFAAFREGLDRRLIFDYWAAVKEHAWEILWGAGAVGIPFGIITLYYAPARSWLGFVIALAILIAGYYVWRTDHLRLVPMLSIGDVALSMTQTNDPNIFRCFVQVRVACVTEGAIENCKGQLIRVMQWSKIRKCWQPTTLDELLDLYWSNVDAAATKIEYGADRRLNICAVGNDWTVIARVGSSPLRATLRCSPNSVFRFDVRIGGDDCPADFFSLKTSVGETWNQVKAEKIPYEGD